MTVLSTRALNRATLARQLLLDRVDLPVLDAVGHLCGLQAQQPQEPFVGLWSRLHGFAPETLSDLLVQRRVVRTHLMRRTVHLPDAPRPDPDTPAPVRFLPAFDNALLGYDDRTRVVDDAHRLLSVTGTRVVLVDGRVSATWTVADDAVAVTPLRTFTRAERSAVAQEADRLTEFLT
jgi:hypothetical protein